MILGSCAVVSWVALGAAYYFRFWLDDGILSPWLLAYPVLWILAIGLTTWWAVRLRRRRSRGWAVVMVCQLVAAVAIAGAVPWEQVFRWSWFETHRTAFAELARLGEGLPPDHSPLPERYRALALGQGAVERMHDPEVPGGDVLFLAVAEWKPERIGFARVLGGKAGTDPCALLNVAYDGEFTCAALDDGWWWMGDNWEIER